ncbi:uncharacterized protein LOC115985008 [Quercus lobata]|uniref:uncharacterized protein LOC115985008 n=1 Tax=Quercus lobata TaxID=97700 RepID=UPI001249166C|nr:uncharacterized protein LOC115985008 [Quercus lobata]
MSTFNIPAKNCDKIDSLIRRFWWKPKEKEGRFIAWKAWDKLCCPKYEGGLGFKKTKDVNNVLLAKLAWLVASSRESLCMDILRAKYKVKHDWLQKDPTKVASPTWRGIENAKKLIVKGACYIIDHTTHSWIPSLVTELFDAASAQAIMSIPIPYSPRLDKLMCTPSSKGVFSVKSAYRVSLE